MSADIVPLSSRRVGTCRVSLDSIWRCGMRYRRICFGRCAADCFPVTFQQLACRPRNPLRSARHIDLRHASARERTDEEFHSISRRYPSHPRALFRLAGRRMHYSTRELFAFRARPRVQQQSPIFAVASERPASRWGDRFPLLFFIFTLGSGVTGW